MVNKLLRPEFNREMVEGMVKSPVRPLLLQGSFLLGVDLSSVDLSFADLRFFFSACLIQW